MSLSAHLKDFVDVWLSPLIPESLTKMAALIGASVWLVVYYITKKRYKLSPGPRDLPLLGNLLSFRNASLYEKLAEWEKLYGPVMTLHLGPLECIILNNLDVIQEAFIQKSADFAGRPQIYSIKVFTEGFKDIAFTDYGPTWQLQRRLALKALKYYMKGDRFEKTVSEVLEMAMEEMRKEKAAVDMKIYIELIIFNILSKICFDEKFAPEDEEFRRFCHLLNKGNEYFASGLLEDFFPPLRICHTPKFRNFERLTHELLAFIYERVNHHRATFSPDVQRDFTDAMLLAQSEAEVDENPELLAEITDTHIGQTVSDIFQDRHKLPYTEAVLYESMRLGSVAPLTVPHNTTCDTTIGSYEIPKGTTVLANLYGVHHDTRYWKEPENFKPERFLDTSGKMEQKPETWMPFSVGKRACLAESLAKPELHLVLAGIMKNFEFQIPEGVTVDITSRKSTLLIEPNPYTVIIKPRNF